VLRPGSLSRDIAAFLFVGRWVQIGSFYTNDGLIPNHTLLWRPSFSQVFSFFYMASSPFAVRGCRRLAILLVIVLHTGFALCLNLGVFVPAIPHPLTGATLGVMHLFVPPPPPV